MSVETLNKKSIDCRGREHDPVTGRYLPTQLSLEQLHSKLDNEIRIWRGGIRTFYLGWKAQQQVQPVVSTWEQSLNAIEEEWNARPKTSPEQLEFLQRYQLEKAEEPKGSERWSGLNRVLDRVRSWQLPRLSAAPLIKLGAAAVLAFSLGAVEAGYNYSAKSSSSEIAAASDQLGRMERRISEDGQQYFIYPDLTYHGPSEAVSEKMEGVHQLLNKYIQQNGSLTDGQKLVIRQLNDLPVAERAKFATQLEQHLTND